MYVYGFVLRYFNRKIAKQKKVEKSLYTELKREAYHNHRQDKVVGDICVFVYGQHTKLAVRSPFLKMDHPMMTGRK